MKLHKKPKILITGVSGTLGSELSRELWSQGKDIVSLGRSNQATIPGVELPFFAMNLDEENLGISDPESLWKDVTCVVHCAADVRWTLPLNKALRSNTYASRLLMQQAQKYAPHLEKFIYVSTAFVDTVSPTKNPAEITQSDFNNTYEYSKYLAEQELMASGLPWTLVRPSIIIGREDTGKIDRFLSIYQLVNLYEQGLLPLLVGHADAVLDFVPVDVVTSAISWSVDHSAESLHKVIYASSGTAAPTMNTVTRLAAQSVNEARATLGLSVHGPIKVIEPESFDRFFLPMMKKQIPRKFEAVQLLLDCFRPYMRIRTPRTFKSDEPAFVCHEPAKALLRCFHYWCEKNILENPAYLKELPSVRVS